METSNNTEKKEKFTIKKNKSEKFFDILKDLCRYYCYDYSYESEINEDNIDITITFKSTLRKNSPYDKYEEMCHSIYVTSKTV